MNNSPRYALIGAVLAALALGVSSAHAFLGVADTSFVTVIANPAEAANWAAELDRLNSQLSAATGTLQVVGDLRTFAGDPKEAVGALADLASVTGAVGNLTSGAQTDADLALAWQSLGASQQLSEAASLLQGAGPGASMQVFGRQQDRDPSLYEHYASDASSSEQLRSQISAEQATRASIASALTQAWAQFRLATTESGKQAILTEISQLQSQDQVMATRRRAVLDDLDLADRQDRTASGVRSEAADEQDLAESSLLNADLSGRAQSAEAQRLATLQKTPQQPQAMDYSGMRLWTTADAGGTSH
jgi:hypothetical protein